MRKTILFIAGLMIAGILSYFGGYYLYVTNRPQMILEEPEMISKDILLSGKSAKTVLNQYYMVKIEEEMLNIYYMPEKNLYDSISIYQLQFQEEDYPELESGKIFSDLPEVFEFLENCMS